MEQDFIQRRYNFGKKVYQILEVEPPRPAYTAWICANIAKSLQKKIDDLCSLQKDQYLVFCTIQQRGENANIHIYIAASYLPQSGINFNYTLYPADTTEVKKNFIRSEWERVISVGNNVGKKAREQYLASCAELFKIVEPYTEVLNQTLVKSLLNTNTLYHEIFTEERVLRSVLLNLRPEFRVIPEGIEIPKFNLQENLLKNQRLVERLNFYETADSILDSSFKGLRFELIEENKQGCRALTPLGKFLWKTLNAKAPSRAFTNEELKPIVVEKKLVCEVIPSRETMEHICFNCIHWNNADNNGMSSEIASTCGYYNKQTLSCVSCVMFAPIQVQVPKEKQETIFRLDPLFGNPCSLCEHNKNVWKQNFFGIPIICDKLKIAKPIQQDAKAMQRCPNFKLDIDKLKMVVYNELSFSSAFQYITKMDRTGKLRFQWDPFWYMYYTVHRTCVSKRFRDTVDYSWKKKGKHLQACLTGFINSGKNKSTSSSKEDIQSMQSIALGINKLWAEIVLGKEIPVSPPTPYTGLIDVTDLLKTESFR